MLDYIAIIISILSFVAALLALKISIQRYDLQVEQHELQLKEYSKKNRIQLHIIDEQFISSHTFGPEQPEYYSKHPDEIEFEYRASYRNKGEVTIHLKCVKLIITAVDIEEKTFACGENVSAEIYLATNEEINIVHRFSKDNFDGFKKYIRNNISKRGIFQFEIESVFSSLDGKDIEHKRILYRMTEGGGDISCKGYTPGKGIIKRNFVY